MSLKKSNAEFEIELQQKNNSVVNLQPYQDARSRILFQCKKCGYQWKTTPDSVLRGSGCARCAGILRKSHEEFVEEVSVASPKIEVLGSYKNNRSRIASRCKICGYVWDADPVRLQNGTNCPNCLHTGTSLVEQCIFVLFEDYFGKGNVESRSISAIGKELDIYVPKEKIAIEFGSWFWHKSKVNTDIEKIVLCREQNIDIVTIFDYYDGNIPFYNSDNNVITYRVDLSSHSEMLKSMLAQVAKYYKIDVAISDQYFTNIKQRAYANCSRKNTVAFIDEVHKVNPDVLILGEYTRARDKIDCSCKKCGYHWTPFADNLLRGQGCPNCARLSASQRLTYSHDVFIHNIQEKLNHNVEIIGNYTSARDKLMCRCRDCYYEWYAIPGDLHHGSGCPRCGGTMKKTHQEFLSEVTKVNPDIDILGEYATHNTPIECRCKKCGHRWLPRPKHLINGHGCPKCAGTLKITHEEFVENIAKKGLAINVLGVYKNCDTPILLECRECKHKWIQSPKSLMKSRGCPVCFPYTEKQDKKWNEMYAVAVEYYKQHGNLLVSARQDFCGVCLGQWIHAQRKAYRNGLLPEEKRNKRIGNISAKRISLLNQLEMQW